ncbi:alpha-galactosidase [Pedobacter sp. KR3-3]|uniref:Alpha-galactosidase n=1 Tax=Pedobacter albus TaxID=3113905 RepID=A0ABU7I2N3_9SPHI|nr:alpha-galactosidase [Pedobacter sp. KR3-3]MEE1943727.1 alpha-galactosidase [Pedobacter sp. KR3-3]
MNFNKILIIACLVFHFSGLQAQETPLPYTAAIEKQSQTDWLVAPNAQKAGIYYTANKQGIILYNGYVRREFALSPGLACIDYKNMSNGQQLLRSPKPEAKITINGKVYQVGGLYGQTENAYYLPQWTKQLHGQADFVYKNFKIENIKPYLHWKPNTWTLNRKQATGKHLSFELESTNPALKDIVITIHYELYDGLPLIVKWLSVQNNSSQAIKIDRVINEVLGIVDEESAVVGTEAQMKKQHGIYIESNYAFNNSMQYEISDQTTHWHKDTTYTSQVNYDYKSPVLLEIYPENAPGLTLMPNETLNSIRTHELLIDTYDRERKGLMIRKMYRTIAPWTTQNPIFMHLVSKNDDEVWNAITQCANTGYEALIMSFGSHCNMEDTTAKNISHWKKIADFAHSKGILIGSYSLFSSRHISEEDDVVNPKTGKIGGSFFGNAPCFGSKWGLGYRDKIKYFLSKTGFNIWENDGPYPGDICASTTHPGHTGKDDSQWKQMEIQKELYRWCNENGIYINAPDWYLLDGTNKVSLGYREVNFSLPREQQKILNRQNIFDGNWEKTPSMSWGFVPLTKYQGGGPEAILEPLAEHLSDYKQLMMQYYGAGVQACYRGPRLYDTEETRKTVVEVINWYKKYREILNSDLIHLRRADGRDWDGWLHVNPQLKQKALLMVFNPLKEKITRTVKVPLYYTGLTQSAKISINGGPQKPYKLNRNYEITIPITLQAEAYQWITVE